MIDSDRSNARIPGPPLIKESESPRTLVTIPQDLRTTKPEGSGFGEYLRIGMTDAAWLCPETAITSMGQES